MPHSPVCEPVSSSQLPRASAQCFRLITASQRTLFPFQVQLIHLRRQRMHYYANNQAGRRNWVTPPELGYIIAHYSERGSHYCSYSTPPELLLHCKYMIYALMRSKASLILGSGQKSINRELLFFRQWPDLVDLIYAKRSRSLKYFIK